MKINQVVINALTPTGKLRAAVNLGNPILATRDPSTGQASGVSIDLARAFAERLSIELELIIHDTAGKSVQTISEDRADIGFFALDPLRGQAIAFTAPYVLIEGFYLVRTASPIVSNNDVDNSGVRVAVGKGSAYDLFLSRTLRLAEIVRAPTSPTVVQAFIERNLDVAAGVKQQLDADARATPGLRLLPERFMVIEQAMGTPRTRGTEATAALHSFVEEMKRSGFVEAALDRHGITGALVAPLA